LKARNEISDYAHIHPNARLGSGNIICHGAIIYDNVFIGDNNYIGEYTTIGVPAGTTKESHDEGVMIGDSVTIREYVTIEAGSERQTKIWSDCFIMSKSHIGHDCIIYNEVTISPQVTLGGFVGIYPRATIGMNATIKQRLEIGEYSMVGMGSLVVKNIKPYMTYANIETAKRIGFNTVGMAKYMSEEDIKKITG